MSTRARAEEIVGKLTAAGVRATVDPQAAAPPAILVPPPGRRLDLGCGFTATWELLALAPAATGTNRMSWDDLDHLADVACSVLPVEEAQLISANLAGLDYPAYLLRWSEALDPTEAP